jgi:hypothetical protein
MLPLWVALLVAAPPDTTVPPTTTTVPVTTTTLVEIIQYGTQETWFSSTALGAGVVCGFVLLITRLMRAERG